MVVAIIVILLIVGVALVGALYSSFLVFYGTFSDTVEYNKAYYSAVSALERAELVLRYRSPGYEGSGGWIGSTGYGMGATDYRPTNFAINGSGQDGIFWTIASRTTTIPKSGEGNTEWMLATGDSFDYNVLDYVNAENITLQLDSMLGHPYASQTLGKSQVQKIDGILRLPEVLRTTYRFGDLDDTMDIGDDEIPDDEVVDWSFRGTYNVAPFQVMPTTAVQYYGAKKVIENKDSLIRESRINANSAFSFAGNYGPYASNIGIGGRDSLTVISAEEDTLSAKTFSELMNQTSDTIFRISLLNLLYAKSENIYPYLEYQFKFFNYLGQPTEVSDRFYTIEALGKYGSYEVKLLVKKPTIKESILGSFTVIF